MFGIIKISYGDKSLPTSLYKREGPNYDSVMQQICTQCQTSFELTDDDLKVYEDHAPLIAGKKYEFPPPTMCPDCRHQRRCAFRNERNLYARKCGKCQKDIVSIYAPDRPYIVYCSDCYWGDIWDPTDYGQDFDFNRPFFEQFEEVLRKVPLLSSNVFNSQNCEYNNFCIDAKDCYMSVRLAGENILYSYLVLNGLGCTDCMNVYECQYCYECIDCWNCYNAFFCQLCKNTSDSFFCYDCIGCKNCFGCTNLRNAEYHFFNEKCSKDEYKEKLKSYDLESYENLKNMQSQFHDMKLKSPHRAIFIENSENVHGDYITNSKNVYNSFDIESTDTARHSWGSECCKNIFDAAFNYYGENTLQNLGNAKSTNIFFSAFIVESHDMIYSMLTYNNCHDCFGCASLKKSEYCILNKQYAKEEYEKLIPKIVDYMKQTGEWGQFFNPEMSTFGYNTSVAQEYFPLTKENALSSRFTWSEYEAPQPDLKVIDALALPDNVNDIPDDVLNWAIVCDTTKKPFRIIKRELDFYRKFQLSLPRKHPDERHRQRVLLRNPRTLWQRQCQKCSKDIHTTYAPEKEEMIYCEECYRKEVY